MTFIIILSTNTVFCIGAIYDKVLPSGVRCSEIFVNGYNFSMESIQLLVVSVGYTMDFEIFLVRCNFKNKSQ